MEERRVDFRSKNRSNNCVKTNVQCEACLRPVFHHLGVDLGTILAPKKEAKSLKNRRKKRCEKTVAKKGTQDRKKGGQNDDQGALTLIGGYSAGIQGDGLNLS